MKTVIETPEAAFQDWLIELACWLGWRVHAERPARTKDGWVTPVQGDPGWPDVVLLKGSRCIVAELKSAKGRTTIDQDDWLEAFRQVPGIETYVFRPKDAELIERILKKQPDPLEEIEVAGWPV